MNERRNINLIFIAAMIAVVLILGCVVAIHAINNRTEKYRIDACAKLQTEVVRAACIQGG